MINKLDISPLINCAIALEKAILYAQKVEMKPIKDREEYEFESARASVIQHFEVAYELCWKFMRRYISTSDWSKEEWATKRDLFRICAECKLISNAERWFKYNDFRNETSHTYEEDAANMVYEVIVEFFYDMKEFIKNLRSRL